MGSQLTVRLSDEIATALASEARATGQRLSEIVRAALEEHLRLKPMARPARAVRRLLGSLASGDPHLADRHREAVLESIRRGR